MNAKASAHPGDGTPPGEDETPDGVLQSLSPRERDVLRLLAGGLSNKEIAEILGISVHTVDVHNRRIFKKLGVRNRTGAANAWNRLRGFRP